VQPGDYAVNWQDLMGPLILVIAVVVVLSWYIVFVQRRRK